MRFPTKATRVAGLVIATAVIVTGTIGAGPAPTLLEIDLSPHGTIRWADGTTPVLVVRPRRGDGWISLASRYTGTTSSAGAIHRANPRLANPMTDRSVSIPVELLRADLREKVVWKLFPIDRRIGAGLEHWVMDPFNDGSESWEWLTRIFAVPGASVSAVKTANRDIGTARPGRGDKVLIPERVLLKVFKDWTPVVPTPTPEPPPTPTPKPAPRPSPTVAVPVTTGGSNGDLSFAEDALGEYAAYRLKRGEALYSAVVVRFTGQLHAAQVIETAQEIARRSGISDVTDIPVGYEVKIPVDLVLPEFLPADHPRRIAYEKEQRELAGFLEVVRAADLSGVHVILDAGHGGRDTGATSGGLWESTYAYDILCRIKENLARHTEATVWTTIRDKSRGFTIPDENRLHQDRDQVLLTRPEHELEDSVAGVHLRWYLANDIILDRIPKSVPRSKVVFVSIHADSLHPSVRGSMIYIPSRHLRPTSYQASVRGLDRHQEYRRHPKAFFPSTFSSKAEASSQHLAVAIIDSLKRNGLMVHANKPIRDRIRRGRSTYVPAVLRYSLAQNAVLVECVNLANAEDRANLTSAKWREDFSRSLVEGIASAFNGD